MKDFAGKISRLMEANLEQTVVRDVSERALVREE
jgi:hypothetical protein